MPYPDRKMQSRMTFQDVLTAQKELLTLIKRKRERNTGLNNEEESDFPSLVAWSTLSHSSTACHYINKDGRTTTFNLYSFALEIKSIRGKEVYLVDGPTGVKYKVLLSELWNFLEKELKNIFPYALEEALHMSREAPVMEKATSHKFSVHDFKGKY